MKIANESKKAQPLGELGQLLASILASDLENVFSDTLERVFTPAARIEELNRKEYLTEKEVAEMFSTSTATLRSQRSRRRGPKYIKDGASVLYRRQDLDDYYCRRMIKTVG